MRQGRSWSPFYGRCTAAYLLCVGWLVHVIHGHYVHAEPRSKFRRGGGGQAREKTVFIDWT